MFYYLAQLLMPYISAMNVLTYHTVRAGGAALTGFLFCVLVGPAIIHRLRLLKIGQFIKKEYVADLHALHKGKAGTPTMGGVMILLSTFLSLLLWGRLSNRLLWAAMAVFLLLGAVGFMDDFIKLKRRHNDGLTARAKFAGQIATGLLLGLYLYFNPITVSATLVYPRDVMDWPLLAQTLQAAALSDQPSAARHMWDMMEDEAKKTIAAIDPARPLSAQERQAVLQGLNSVLGKKRLYDPAFWTEESLTGEARNLLSRGAGALSNLELIRLDRLLIEAAFPELLADSEPNLHTKVGIPGFKNTYLPLGPLYILLIIFIIVSVSNAVNLTDGLDGLAAGASVISIMAFAAIAYIVSRADWSHYLFLTYVPESSELFVFGSALLGTGLGFLWFNGHPAEVFMGDTGSLALGGAIATMAILTKQELLLPLVAGLFVIEAASVVIQVASYKLTGKRVFRMAPIHHHFELLGWSETKVTMRFWIIALLFALMSLGTLKLR
jgi:UDP-N-acetylmuramyl pentapeptide phosphotransferase/UDP-N-acetylglucosamine-1-phosphate transferase